MEEKGKNMGGRDHSQVVQVKYTSIPDGSAGSDDRRLWGLVRRRIGLLREGRRKKNVDRLLTGTLFLLKKGKGSGDQRGGAVDRRM